MENTVDPAALLEDMASGGSASAVGGWMLAAWGMLSMKRVLLTVVLLAALLAASRLVMALLKRLADRSHLDPRLRPYLLRGVKALLYLLAALVAAGSLGVDVTSLIALVSVFGLAVSLAVQDVLSNVAGGMVLLFSKPFSLGDYVDTGEGEGEVAEITLTHIKLDTFSGQRVMLPNSKVVAGKITNYTVRGVRRADLAVSASYDDSTAAVRAACLKAVSRTPHVLPDPAPQVVLTAYRESAIEYRVRFWAETPHFWDANNTALEELRRAFEEDGVTMTYNHLNVHLVDGKNTKEK